MDIHIAILQISASCARSLNSVASLNMQSISIGQFRMGGTAKLNHNGYLMVSILVNAVNLKSCTVDSLTCKLFLKLRIFAYKHGDRIQDNIKMH